MNRRITDAEWLEALDAGLTSTEAAERLGCCRTTCQRNARRLGRKWFARTAIVAAQRLQDPEFRARLLKGLRAAKIDRGGMVRRNRLDRLNDQEKAEYRHLRYSKRMSRIEAARLIGRPDILRPEEIEGLIAERMRSTAKAESSHARDIWRRTERAK